jgi:diguanylate cyclase (GGDEF)-like protein
MKRLIVKLPNVDRGRLALLVGTVALLIVGAMVLCNTVASTMLRDDARDTSHNWVRMLVGRNPEILAMLSGAAPSVQTKHLLDEASRVGDIYRFRIWDKAGNLVFNSERMTSVGAPTAITRKQIDDTVASGSVISEVHKGSPPHDVPYFVDSFIPVERNGSTIGLFEVYLDQSLDEALYKKSLLFTEGIIAILVILAGGLPGCLVYSQMQALRVAEAEALFLSEHDGLTGISNRNRLSDVSRGVLALNRRSKSHVAVLTIDLDRFKDINDTFGHAAGDEVLKAVAKRLESSLREEDSVARFGGDEFVVLQVGMAQPSGARFLADRIIEALSEPFEFGGTKMDCGASIGVALSPPDADDFETLVACADAALYKSKAMGRNSLSFFESGMDAEIRERRQIEKDIRLALTTNSFQLAYQPLHNLRDGKILGFEALLRWPEGWIPKTPAVFIPVAEESGLINHIGAWALETACKTAAQWTNPLKVAVNLSPVQFRHGDIVSIVGNALRISGLPAERLELEVTETLWIQDGDSVLDQLKQLRQMGVSIALDDFGTGYSSLAYLWKFPFDTVKIDRSFVSQMESEPKAAAIVDTITGLGKTLGLTITAEGVETLAQATFLKEAGCDQAQGYLFGRPLPAAAANALANANPLSVVEEPDTHIVF